MRHPLKPNSATTFGLLAKRRNGDDRSVRGRRRESLRREIGAERRGQIVAWPSYLSGGLRHFAMTGRLPFAEPCRQTGSSHSAISQPSWPAWPRRPPLRAIAPVGAIHGCLHIEVASVSRWRLRPTVSASSRSMEGSHRRPCGDRPLIAPGLPTGCRPPHLRSID
jgi:hypothetical protein